MTTKTIGITEDVYERLRARKRGDESFTDLIDRLLKDVTPDWREGFGSLSIEEMNELQTIASTSRQRLDEDLSHRQVETIERLGQAKDDVHEAP